MRDDTGNSKIIRVVSTSDGSKTLRLDQALVTQALARSRSQAADLIRRGFVSIDGVVALKASQSVGTQQRVVISDAAPLFVGRGAEKLIAALDQFEFEPDGCIALDIGASTGGFTEVLLKRGAAKIYAVDVGHGQLHASLTSNPRVINCEGIDARSIDAVLVPDLVGAIVADVSFISATKALPAALARADRGAWLVLLVKPQFEAGRAAVGKGGIVRDEAVQRQCVEAVIGWLETSMGWRVLGAMQSPITGGDGNQEYLVGAVRA